MDHVHVTTDKETWTRVFYRQANMAHLRKQSRGTKQKRNYKRTTNWHRKLQHTSLTHNISVCILHDEKVFRVKFYKSKRTCVLNSSTRIWDVFTLDNFPHNLDCFSLMRFGSEYGAVIFLSFIFLSFTTL